MEPRSMEQNMNRGVKLKSNAKLAQSVKHPKPTVLQVDNSCQDKRSSIYLSKAELFKLSSLQVSLKTSTFFYFRCIEWEGWFRIFMCVIWFFFQIANTHLLIGSTHGWFSEVRLCRRKVIKMQLDVGNEPYLSQQKSNAYLRFTSWVQTMLEKPGFDIWGQMDEYSRNID